MPVNAIEGRKSQSGKETRHAPIPAPKKEYRPSLEEIQEYWRPDKFMLNGKQVETYGVAHDIATLAVPEIHDKLLSAVNRASIVLSEGRPVRKDEDPKKIVALLRSLGLGKEYSDRDLEEYFRKPIKKSRDRLFFEKIIGMAARKGVKIATADPYDETAQRNCILEVCNNDIESFKMVAATGGIGIWGSAYLLEKLLKDNKKISRRSFLQLLGAGAAGAALGSMLSIGASKENKPGQYGRAKNPLGAALYTLIDYRDVAVAEGLDQLTKRNFGEGPVVAVYGAFHTDAIKHYATHPIERKAKLASYLPYRSMANPELEIFEFDGRWKEVEKL